MFSSGKLRYSPQINGTWDRRDGGTTKWWLVVDADPEIGRYYRTLYNLITYRCQRLQRPAWEAHVSAIRDEKPPKPQFWKRYEGFAIEFEYDPKPEFNETYVWLPVKCPIILDLREELGLPREPMFPLHLTIGNCKNV